MPGPRLSASAVQNHIRDIIAMTEYIVPIAVMLLIVVLVIGPPGMMLVAMTVLSRLFA